MCQEISAGVGNKEKKHEMEGNTEYEEGSFAGEGACFRGIGVLSGKGFISCLEGNPQI